MNSEHARCVGWLQTYRLAYTNHFSPTLSYPNCDGARFPPTLNTHYLTCNVQLTIFQTCNRLAWVWQTRWQRLNGEERTLCGWIHSLDSWIICIIHARLRTRSWDRGPSVVSTWYEYSWEFNILLKNRSSADCEVIEGGKDRGERNGVSYGVMPPFSLMLRPLLEKSRRILETQLTICHIPAIT